MFLDRGHVSITPLGGVNQVGQNFILYANRGYSVGVDCGIRPLTFEERDSGREWGDPPCLDILDRIMEEGSNVMGIITHAHLDHIGAVAELGKRRIPVFMSYWSRVLKERYADNLKIPVGARFNSFKGIVRIDHGDFRVIPIPVHHSIPGTHAVLMQAGGKNILHLSDFKFNGLRESVEQTRETFREIRRQFSKIDCLVLDVLNAELPGYTPPEQQVFDSVNEIMEREKGRIIITFFSSNIERMAGILDIAARHGRKVRLAGWGMSNSYALLRRYDRLYRDDWDLLLVSGSQGEQNSGLVRMARGEHYIKLCRGDTVAILSRGIPGNEDSIRDTLQRLSEKGVKIIPHQGETAKLSLPFISQEMFLHSSGHEQMGGLQEVVDIMEPAVIVPFHAPPEKVDIFIQNVRTSAQIVRLQVGETLEI